MTPPGSKPLSALEPDIQMVPLDQVQGMIEAAVAKQLQAVKAKQVSEDRERQEEVAELASVELKPMETADLLPKMPATRTDAYWLRPDGATLRECLVTLDGAEPHHMDRRQRRGFVCLGRRAVAKSGMWFFAEQLALDSLPTVAKVLASRKGAEVKSLRSHIRRAERLDETGHLSAGERSINLTRLQRLSERLAMVRDEFPMELIKGWVIDRRTEELVKQMNPQVVQLVKAMLPPDQWVQGLERLAETMYNTATEPGLPSWWRDVAESSDQAVEQVGNDPKRVRVHTVVSGPNTPLVDAIR